MSDLITLSDSMGKRPQKPENYREKQHDDQHGRIRYQRRKIQDKDAKQEIREYQREQESGTKRVY